MSTSSSQAQKLQAPQSIKEHNLPKHITPISARKRWGVLLSWLFCAGSDARWIWRLNF
jgi:hypothetical protein